MLRIDKRINNEPDYMTEVSDPCQRPCWADTASPVVWLGSAQTAQPCQAHHYLDPGSFLSSSWGLGANYGVVVLAAVRTVYLFMPHF